MLVYQRVDEPFPSRVRIQPYPHLLRDVGEPLTGDPLRVATTFVARVLAAI